MQDKKFDYVALTLDSNVFIGHGLNLERGLLAQLHQFSKSPIDFLISDVVLGEIRKHLLETTKTSRTKLQSAIRGARIPFVLADNSQEEVEKMALGTKTDVEVVDARIRRFLEETKAEVVGSAGLDVSRLLKIYFDAEPPFAGVGDKKSEFPDAIALLSLEGWAKEKGAKLLAVSKDGGWGGFAKESAHVDVIEDLAEALAHFQPHHAAQEIIEALQGQIVGGGGPSLEIIVVSDFVKESINGAEVEVEYSSALHADLDAVQVRHQSHKYLDGKDGRPAVDLISIEEDWLSLRLRLEVWYEITAEFSFSVWDSVDRDYVSVGGTERTLEKSKIFDVIVSLTGNFSSGIANVEVGELEINLNFPSANFGDVEPNMDDD